MNSLKVGFKFDSNHVWTIEELQELQKVISEFDLTNFKVGETVYITSHSSIIHHDFIVCRNDNNVIVLRED